jgi:hypothetical protein
MKTTKQITLSAEDQNFMKRTLLFGSGATLVFCAISTSPHWLVRLLLGVAALLAILHELSRRAPIGYEDERGFHYVREPRRRRGAFAGSILSPTRSPLKA